MGIYIHILRVFGLSWRQSKIECYTNEEKLNMKKKILLVLPHLGIGGTTVSVRNQLSLLQKEGYDCWVMALYPQGILSHLFEGLNRVETPIAIRILSAPSLEGMPLLIIKPLAFVLRFLCHHFVCVEKWIVGRALNKVINRYQFDSIVAEQENGATQFVSYAKCRGKVAWVRCDYKRYFEDRQFKKEGFYQAYNAIVCVSEQTCNNFNTIYPEYTSKTYCIPNPQDSELIQARADTKEDEPRFFKNGKTFVSIGRFDVIKRFESIAPIARKLVDDGLKFRWYLIGDGNERQNIEDSIQKYDIADYVVMLGVKTNPYYYIKKADLLVCLSASEACPRVVNEAKILHTPTISTDFPTIYEFIDNGKTGLIAPLEEIPSAIKRICDDTDLYKRIKDNICAFSFDNTDILSAIRKIL